MTKKRKGYQPSEEKLNNSAPVVSESIEKATAEDPRVQLVKADFDKQAALEEAGGEDKVYGFWGKVYKFYNWYHDKTHGFRFKKKTYLWLLFLTGWAGGHRWYQGRRVLGAIETCICWTGLPLILCVQDFMEVFPIKADEDGYIVM